MRKFLFYTWCIGGLIVYGLVVRWAVRSIAENYGITAMAVSVSIWLGFCFFISWKIDKADAIAAEKLAGYRRGQWQGSSEVAYLPPPDDLEV